MKKILFIPIDNRPITYSLTKQIADVNKSLELELPKRELLGGLTTKANAQEILSWLKNEETPDLIILSLDTIVYGGLVSSRRGKETYDEIKSSIFSLKEILLDKKEKNKNLKILATSSIMRISNNNVNEEEKEYWDKYGEKLFRCSYEFHKNGSVKTDVPKEILEDYLNTRKRNFEANKIYLNLVEEKIFDYLIYSKDDTGEFGFNVMEAEFFENEIKKRKLNANIKTGADEIPLGLLLRGITEDIPLKIKIVYANPDSTDKISRYEDISVKKCVEAQIKLGLKNGELTNNNPDLILYANNFENKQGDLVFQDIINSSKNELPNFEKPFIIADINNANGSDNKLVENILEKSLDEKFLGYSGYNTSANTIGSALCLGVISYLAKKENLLNENAFKKVLAIRFLDDWGYQANERTKVQESKENFEKLDFSYYEQKINKFLKTNFKAEYSLPWNRSFEIEVTLL